MTKSDQVRDILKNYDGPQLRFMEVCGSHTRAVNESGIPQLLSDKIELISGPGCPVCVTPSAYIDRLIELAKEPGNIVVTFGDLIRVPGSVQSLADARAQGARVKMVYSPLNVLQIAADNPEDIIVFAAVGFETTAPAYADLLHRIERDGTENVRLLTALKTMPPVITYLMKGGDGIDGFLAPGHVSVITGANAFEPLAKRFGIPFVVAGFGPEELLTALYDLVKNAGRGIVINDYPSVVTAAGNIKACEEVARYFEPSPAVWRGIGSIPGSGLILREEYRKYDAGSIGLDSDSKKNPACICGQVLTGRKKPEQCPLWGRSCTPETPQGACMVSSEGSCLAHLLAFGGNE